MRRITALAPMMLLTVVAACGPVGAPQVSAQQQQQRQQQPACLHGPQEQASQAARKQGALAFVRRVNTAQAKAVGSTGSYLSGDQLPFASQVPDGFAFQFAGSGQAYAFSVQDMSDPCRLAFFSDQAGLIFHGEVIR
jgi:hypothetical protein